MRLEFKKKHYSQVPIKRVGPNKRVGWIFIKYFCLSLCLFLSSCFFGAKKTSILVYLAPKSNSGFKNVLFLSVGMSLVKSPEGLDTAVKTAFTHSSNVIIDKFIAGRELRCSVVEVVDQSGT
jgi:hypothetical protein